MRWRSLYLTGEQLPDNKRRHQEVDDSPDRKGVAGRGDLCCIVLEWLNGDVVVD